MRADPSPRSSATITRRMAIPHETTFNGRRVFVTGAYGLVGACMTRELLERGASLMVLRRVVRPGSRLVLDGIEQHCRVVTGDLLDAELIDRAVGEHRIDTVMHFGAQSIVGTAQQSPRSTLESNVRGTWNVLEACRVNDVQRTIVAASSHAYGPSDVLPYTEDVPLRARHPYDASKAAAALIARSYWHTYGLPVAVTRFANIYGGGDQNRSRLIPEAIAAVLEGRAPVVRSDGSPQRDYLYVDDAVRAYLAIADLLDAGPARGEAFNGGSGVPRSVLDVISAVCAAAGVDVTPDVRGTGTPAGEIDRQWVDPSKLTGLSGWQPQVGLDEGLRRTIEWYRANPGCLAGA